MRRFRIGLVNYDVTIPPTIKLRYACYTNDERNLYTNTIFIQHLNTTHTQADNDTNKIMMQFNAQIIRVS